MHPDDPSRNDPKDTEAVKSLARPPFLSMSCLMTKPFFPKMFKEIANVRSFPIGMSVMGPIEEIAVFRKKAS
jgi:hypothetical protein